MAAEKEESKLGAGGPPRARRSVAAAWPSAAHAALLGARTLAREASPPVASLPFLRRISETGVAADKAKRTAPRSETRQRQAGVKVRLTAEERAVVEERADAAGLSIASYLRAAAIGDAGPRARRSPTVDRTIAADAIAALNKAGGNLNQIAKQLNTFGGPAPAGLPDTLQAVKQAALQILLAFGYKTHDSEG